jgi:hypothetical protein
MKERKYHMTNTDFVSLLAILSAISTITDMIACVIFANVIAVVGIYFHRKLNK